MRRICFTILLLCSLLSSIANAIDIIANPNVAVESLPTQVVRNIFSMRVRHWPNGTPITVFVLDDNNPLHKQFSKNILNVLPYKLRRTWDRNIYSGIGEAPILVSSEKDMIRAIATTKGAIGYANKGGANVRIIQIR